MKTMHQQNIEITCSNALKSHAEHRDRLYSLNTSLYHGEAQQSESRSITCNPRCLWGGLQNPLSQSGHLPCHRTVAPRGVGCLLTVIDDS